MAYNSAHTGPEIDAAVQLLGEIQSAKDATAADRQAVSGMAATVASQASQVGSQAASVSSNTAVVLASASAVEADRAEVEQNTDLALSAKTSAEEAEAVAVSAKEAVEAIQLAVSQSQVAINLSEQNAGDSASSARTDREIVETLAQQAEQDSASAAASAASAAAVVTGGTATLLPEPGKIPLAKGDGKIDQEWLPPEIARSSAVEAVSEKADTATSAAEAAEARTAGFLAPSAEPPVLRDDGLPLQEGDRYFNTEERTEYIYTDAGWEANDSQQAISDLGDEDDPAKGAAGVGFDGAKLDELLLNAKSMQGYSELRAYTGRATGIKLTSLGLAGNIYRDPSVTKDNGGTEFLDGIGRGWKREFSGPAMASWFEVKGDDSTNDNSALVRFFEFAATGYAVEINPGMVCRFTQITIPDGVNLVGKSVLRVDATLSGSQVAVNISSNSFFEHLVVTTPGTESAFDLVHISNDVTMSVLEIKSDVQRSGTGGVVLTGNNFYLEKLVTVNIARPFQAQSPVPGLYLSNVNIFEYDITRYIRGINLTAVDGYHIGPGQMRVQDSRASKSPGHNGMLIIASKNGKIDDGDIGDSGEHGIRIGGSYLWPGGCEQIDFGSMTIRRPGGCGFKSNPDPGEVLKDCTIAWLIVEDGGRDTTDGNAEPLRVTEFEGLSVGGLTVRSTSYATTCTAAIALSSGKGLNIGPVNAPNCKDRIVRVIDTQDETTGDLEDIEIGPISGSVTDDRIPIELTYLDTVNQRNIGNVRFKIGSIDSFTVALLEVTGSPTTTGPVRVVGNVVGTTTPNIICPASDDWQADIAWKGFRYIGRAADAMYGYPMALSSGQFNPALAGTAALSMKSRGTAGLNRLGSGITLTRINSTRQAVGWALKQTGDASGRFQYGQSFFVQNSGSASDESMTEAMVINHLGVISEPLMPVYADNAAAKAAGLTVKQRYHTATGEVRIVV